VLIFQGAKDLHCEFVPLIRPTQLADKKVVRKSATVNEIDQNKADHLQQLFNDHSGLFTNVTGRYCSKNNVGNTGMNVGIVPYKTEGYYVDIWHAGKFDTADFRKTFTDLCTKHGMEAKFQKSRGYVNGDKVLATSDAVDAFKIFVAALENKEIYA
jgi:hypothetical protein